MRRRLCGFCRQRGVKVYDYAFCAFKTRVSVFQPFGQINRSVNVGDKRGIIEGELYFSVKRYNKAVRVTALKFRNTSLIVVYIENTYKILIINLSKQSPPDAIIQKITLIVNTECRSFINIDKHYIGINLYRTKRM